MPAHVPVRGAPPAPPKPAVAPRKPRAQPQTTSPALGPPWNVVLLDDQFHTFQYVIDMLQVIFGHPQQLGLRMAEEVNDNGRVIVATLHKELAELRKRQIEDFGPDPCEKRAVGQVSMRAVLEPCLS